MPHAQRRPQPAVRHPGPADGLHQPRRPVAAMHAWVLDKAKPLGQILVEQKALAADAARPARGAGRRSTSSSTATTRSRAWPRVSSVGSVRAGPGADRRRRPAGQPGPRLAPATADDDPDATGRHRSARRPRPALRFRILRPHAKGGLGEVFVAHDEELHREVALKEIQDRHADDPDSRARFLLEAEITGGLEHPGIVPVYGLGQLRRRPALLRHALHPGRQPQGRHRALPPGRRPRPRPGRARRWSCGKLLGRFLDVCNAIAYAHSRGVLHRDLKPGNIMLGKYGETLVVDWGLAKAVGPGRSASRRSGEARCSRRRRSGSAPTLTGAALGTPAYMSPEQAAGRLDQLGPASDVYSLGATLYCLLTGQAPFDGQRRRRRAAARCSGASSRRRGRSSRDVPPALEAICLKAMALRPEDRYASPRDAGRGHRALAGRRAGDGLPRAVLPARAGRGGAQAAGVERRRRGPLLLYRRDRAGASAPCWSAEAQGTRASPRKREQRKQGREPGPGGRPALRRPGGGAGDPADLGRKPRRGAAALRAMCAGTGPGQHASGMRLALASAAGRSRRRCGHAWSIICFGWTTRPRSC